MTIETTDLRYTRAVLKISGESLGPTRHLDSERMKDVAQSIAAIHALGVATTVIVGGGNIFRGNQAGDWGIDQPLADKVGMTATGVNALLLHGMLHAMDVASRIFTRGPSSGVGDPYQQEDVCDALDQGQVVLLAGGMGVSGMSTDVSAVHAAVDTGSPAIIMAKHGIEGVYDADPKAHPEARLLPELTASEAIQRKLAVMDTTALVLARDHDKRIHVVPATDVDAAQRVIRGAAIGSVIHPI